jgi:AcrR family transcriptional regulator
MKYGDRSVVRSPIPQPNLRDILPGELGSYSAKRLAALSRCDAIISHARAQITTVGVDRFNVNEVLRRAGGSKATLAKYFGDRTGLIAAAIEAEARSAMAALVVDTEDAHSSTLKSVLERALGGVLRFYLTPASLALYRAVVGASVGDQRGALAFYHQGHAVVVDAISQLLECRKGADVRSNLDSRDVADQLVHAIRAGIFERALIGVAQLPICDSEIDARVAATVGLVLPGLLIGETLDLSELS